MVDSSHNDRLKELTDLIENERDHDKFTELIAELNALLDEQKKPPSPADIICFPDFRLLPETPLSAEISGSRRSPSDFNSATMLAMFMVRAL